MEITACRVPTFAFVYSMKGLFVLALGATGTILNLQSLSIADYFYPTLDKTVLNFLSYRCQQQGI